MKIKEIILRETLEQAKVISTTPTNKPDQMQVKLDVNGKPVDTIISKDQIKTTDGTPTLTISDTQLNPLNTLSSGQSVAVQTTPSTATPPTTSSQPTVSTTTTTPSTATSPTTSNPTPNTSSTNPPPNQLKVEEIDEEDPNDFSDNELIQTATHKGMEDSLEFDDDGVLINRDEIIDLLQNGQEFGGDPTDDFISDVEDDEYDQLLEKIRHLSGL